jgi:hypothetical protein
VHIPFASGGGELSESDFFSASFRGVGDVETCRAEFQQVVRFKFLMKDLLNKCLVEAGMFLQNRSKERVTGLRTCGGSGRGVILSRRVVGKLSFEHGSHAFN